MTDLSVSENPLSLASGGVVVKEFVNLRGARSYFGENGYDWPKLWGGDSSFKEHILLRGVTSMTPTRVLQLDNVRRVVDIGPCLSSVNCSHNIKLLERDAKDSVMERMSNSQILRLLGFLGHEVTSHLKDANASRGRLAISPAETDRNVKDTMIENAREIHDFYVDSRCSKEEERGSAGSWTCYHKCKVHDGQVWSGEMRMDREEIVGILLRMGRPVPKHLCPLAKATTEKPKIVRLSARPPPTIAIPRQDPFVWESL